MTATEHYFHVVLCVMLYKVILTFESVDEILQFSIQLRSTGGRVTIDLNAT